MSGSVGVRGWAHVHDHREGLGDKADAPDRAVPAPIDQGRKPVFGPMTPDRVLALQRSVGNQAVSRLLAEQRHDHDPASQRDLVDEALRSSSRPIEVSRREKLEAFHQADFSGVRVHTGPVAQRSAAAIGASAFTVGDDIVLGADANNDETLSHETRHVKQQRDGRVAGTDNGAGMAVSDPEHEEEKEAAADGEAFRTGAERAPSVAIGTTAPMRDVQRARNDDPVGPGSRSVQRTPDEDMSDADVSSNEDESSSEEEVGGRKPTHAKVMQKVQVVVEKSKALVYGGGHHGRATEEARLRFERDKRGGRTAQTLSHLSFLLYDAMLAVQDRLNAQQPDGTELDDREVQGMLINDRLVFASNFNESVDQLGRVKLDNAVAPLRELLRFHQSNERRGAGLSGPEANEYVQRLTRAETKIDAVFEELRGMEDDHTADAVRAKTKRPVIIRDAADPDMRELLTADEHAGSVILLRFAKADGKTREGEHKPKSMHAEQKLLVAIHRAGLKPKEVADRPLVIAGKYRPCVGCAAALQYYRDIGGFGNLQFNPNYGHYYRRSVHTLTSHLRHVVADPHYRQYLAAMLSQQDGAATSTPALSGMAPPHDATFNNGPETRIPITEALGRGYVTASDSEGELADDEDEGKKVYNRSKRKSKHSESYAGSSGGRKIGAGYQKGGRPADPFVASKEEAEELKRVWEGGDRQQQAEVFRRYYRRTGAGVVPIGIPEIIARTGASADVVRNLISGRTGHEARDNRARDANRIPRGKKADPTEKKSKPAKSFTKGKDLDDDGRKEILRHIASHRGFHRVWQDARANDKPKITPSAMPRPLGKEIADLRHKYNVPSMAEELWMTPDALKNHLNRTFGSINRKQPAPTAAKSTPVPSTPARTIPERDTDDDIEMGGTSPAAQHREFNGFRHMFDQGSGQHYYVAEDTGRYYYHDDDTDTLHPFPEAQQPGSRAPAASQAGPSRSGPARQAPPPPELTAGDLMDVDESSEQSYGEYEEEEEYTGKGKGRSLR